MVEGDFSVRQAAIFKATASPKKYFSACKKQFRFDPFFSPYGRGGIA